MAALRAFEPVQQPEELKRARRFLAAVPIAPIGVLVAYVAVAAVLMAPVWAAPSTSVAGSNPSDSGFIIWNLRWVSYALSHSQNPFLTTHIDWPAGVNLMWNVEMPLAGLLMWPVTAL